VRVTAFIDGLPDFTIGVEEEYLIDRGSDFRFVAVEDVEFQSGHGRYASTRKVTVYQGRTA